MGKHKSFLKIVILAAIFAVFLTACGGGESGESPISGIGDLAGNSSGSPKEDDSAPDRDATSKVLENKADGTATFSGNGATVDYSNASDGYVMVQYQGDNSKVKVQITKAGEIGRAHV